MSIVDKLNTSIDILRHRRSLLIITILHDPEERDDRGYIHSHLNLSIFQRSLSRAEATVFN